MFFVPWQAYCFIGTAHFPLWSYSGKCACPNSRHMARTVPSLFGGVIVWCISLRLKDFNLRYLFYFRLALYVYEYLLHVGAQKAAQTFLSEVSAYFRFNFFLICQTCLIIWLVSSDLMIARIRPKSKHFNVFIIFIDE